MTRIGPRSRTFVATIGAARIAQRPVPPPELLDPRGPEKSWAFDPTPLLAARVPEKVVKAHGPALSKASEEVRTLSALSERLEPWQAKFADRTLEQVYRTLGQLLSAAAVEDTAKISQQALKVVVDLVESTPRAQRLPALTATNGLVDSALRRIGKQALSMDGASLGTLYVDATHAVQDLLARVAGRRGIGSALHVLPRLVEQLELDVAHSTATERRSLTQGVVELLEHGPARAGFDLAVVAQISADLEASRGADRTPAQVLGRTLERQHQPSREAWNATRAILEADLAPTSSPSARALAMALLQVLDANPSGPAALFEQVKSLRAVAKDHAGSEQASRVEFALSKLLPKLATAPTLPVILAWVVGEWPTLKADFILPTLEKTASFEGAALARELLKLAYKEMGQDLDRPGRVAIDGIAKLPASLATTVVSVLLSKIGEDLERNTLQVVLERAWSAGDDPQAELSRLYDSQQALEEHLAYYTPPKRAQASVRSALGALPIPLDAELLLELLPPLNDLLTTFPKIEPEALLYDEPEGRTGLLSLAAANPRRATSAAEIVMELCKAVRQAGPDARSQSGAARLVMALADQLSLLFAAQEQIQARVLTDLKTALANPKRLQEPAEGVKVLSLRTQGASAVAYAASHPELPLEMVFTAGLHLGAGDLSWVLERAQKTRGKAPVRLLRDALFAAVEAKQTGIFTALRESNSPEAAKTAVVQELAQHFRVDQVEAIDFATLKQGLKEGIDPVGIAQAARTERMLKELNLEALAGGGAVPEGLAEVLRVGDNVAELLHQFRTAFKSGLPQIDMGRLGPVLREVLKSVLEGTWPAPKYEDEVGIRQLAILTPAQREIWRSTTVTLPNQAAQTDPELAATARPLLQGLAKVLGEYVQVEAPGFAKLSFDTESRDRLRQAYAQKSDAIKATKKGSAEQGQLAQALGPIREALALIELQLGIGANLRRARGNTVRALRDSAPLLIAARPALAKLGAAGLVHTAADLLAMSPKEDTSDRLGRHAADEDSLTAMIASHTSGCLAFGNSLHRWGLAGALADANTKMLRTYDGDQQVYRALLRVVPVEMAGYQGPAVYVEGPKGDGGGTPDDRNLLFKGLLAKASAMRVPVLRPENVPESWNKLNLKVTITYDYGHTGLYHSDDMGSLILQGNGGKPAKKEIYLTVAFPPGVGPKSHQSG